MYRAGVARLGSLLGAALGFLAYAACHLDRALLEASGGITLENLPAFAASGVHRVSIGALTHSATAVDVALEIEDGPGAP